MSAKGFFRYNKFIVTDSPNEKKSNFLESLNLGYWLDIVKTVLIVGFFVLFFRFFIIQPYYILGSSMEPDYHNGEYLFVDEISYRFTPPERGNVIVLRHPDDACISYVESSKIMKTFFQGPCKNYIKRIVGLPGETVKIESGKVYIINKDNPQGFELKEPYIEAGLPTLGDQTVTVGENQYFVLGDNRKPNASSDSRDWGLLDKKYIVGKGWLMVLPLRDFGLLKDPTY